MNKRIRPYAYDERCSELAEYFLRDREREPSYEDELRELAQRLQECAEGYCQEVESAQTVSGSSHG